MRIVVNVKPFRWEFKQTTLTVSVCVCERNTEKPRKKEAKDSTEISSKRFMLIIR